MLFEDAFMTSDVEQFSRVYDMRMLSKAVFQFLNLGKANAAKFTVYGAVDPAVKWMPLPNGQDVVLAAEASARAALDLQDMLIKPIQRYVKRQVERELFSPIVSQAGLDAGLAKVRLNFGSPESPELVVSDLIHAAETGLIRQDEFRKNAVKFGWELSEPNPNAAKASPAGEVGVGNQSNQVAKNGG
jgi:hypothetical protein